MSHAGEETCVYCTFDHPPPVCSQPPTPLHRCDPTLHLSFKVGPCFSTQMNLQLPYASFLLFMDSPRMLRGLLTIEPLRWILLQ